MERNEANNPAIGVTDGVTDRKKSGEAIRLAAEIDPILGIVTNSIAQ